MLEIHLRLDKDASHQQTVFAKVVQWPTLIHIGETVMFGGEGYLVDVINHDILNNFIMVYAYRL